MREAQPFHDDTNSTREPPPSAMISRRTSLLNGPLPAFQEMLLSGSALEYCEPAMETTSSCMITPPERGAPPHGCQISSNRDPGFHASPWVHRADSRPWHHRGHSSSLEIDSQVSLGSMLNQVVSRTESIRKVSGTPPRANRTTPMLGEPVVSPQRPAFCVSCWMGSSPATQIR